MESGRRRTETSTTPGRSPPTPTTPSCGTSLRAPGPLRRTAEAIPRRTSTGAATEVGTHSRVGSRTAAVDALRARRHYGSPLRRARGRELWESRDRGDTWQAVRAPRKEVGPASRSPLWLTSATRRSPRCPWPSVRHRPALGSARRVRRNGRRGSRRRRPPRPFGRAVVPPVECALELAGDLLLDARCPGACRIVETSFDCRTPRVEEGSGGAGGDDGSGVATPSESLFLLFDLDAVDGELEDALGAPRFLQVALPVEDRHPRATPIE